MAKSSPTWPAVLFVVFFGAAFFLPGAFVGYLAGRTVVDTLRGRTWAETQADIETVDLESHSDGERTTCKVTCAYTYSWAGQQYEGRQLAFGSGCDNVGSWQQSTYRRLRAAADRGEQVPCYVNPARPSEAVLDRDVRFWRLVFLLVFPSIFGSIGGAIVVGGIIARYELCRGRVAAPPGNAAEPWLKNPAWASGVIRAELSLKAFLAVLVAVIWNVVWTPLLIFLPAEVLRKGNPLALLALAGPLIGWLLILVAYRSVSRNRKFGGSYLQLRTLPGVIGGHLGADLVLRGEVVGIDSVLATLKCVNKVSRGDDSSTETLWRDTRTLDAPATVFGQSELRIPIDFQIPGTCRSSDDSDPKNTVTWRLDIKAAAPGVDLALDFEVPVFRTEASDPTLGETPEKVETERAVVENDASPVPGKIRIIRDEAGQITLVNSARPSVGFVITFVIASSACSGVAVFSAIRVYQHDWFMLMFLAIFGLVSVGGWLVALCCLGSFRITFEPQSLRRERRWGPLRWRHTLSHAEIEDVSYKQSASSGVRKWYRVYAQVSGGRKITLAGMVPGEAAAKWYVRQVLQRTTAGQPAPLVG